MAISVKDAGKYLTGEKKVVTIDFGSFTADVNKFLFSPPDDCKIERAVLLSDTAVSAGDVDNHYDFQIANLTQTKDLLSSEKTTQGAGNNIVADAPYYITADQNKVVQAGDVIEFQASITGTPDSLGGAQILVQLEYRLAWST